MSVIELVIATANEGKGEELGKALLEGLKSQAEHPGCSAVRLLRSVERPNEFLLDLEWDSVEAHVAWQESPGGRERFRAGLTPDVIDWDSRNGLKHYTVFGTVL